ncbi:MAG: ATP-binding cassette domain-containing protein, partial [Gammaproteobacteria bacterium]|nr:ATP-binding cassette domain-containing protein [Gammaproteobacteria bacterium]
ENMGFSLKIAGQSDAEIEKKVDDVAKRLALTELLARKPSELSGGQRQRVAMGRAIVRNPAAFLFDEPLSNLDAKLRTEMRAEIKRLHQALKTTIVYVTHDQTEAMTLADRIVVLRGGHIEQLDTPDAIYHQPKNLFVAQFIGSPPMNIARGVVEADCVRLEAGLTLPLDPAARSVTIGQEVIVGLRPDDLNPTGHGVGEDNRVAFETSVALTEPMGGESIIYCDVGNGLEWLAKMYDAKPVKTGERIELSFQRDKLHLFDAVTEQRIS